MRPKTDTKPRKDVRSHPSGKGRSTASRPVDLDDDALLDLVQRQTLRYFWDFAHPACGLARERSNVRPEYGLETVTTGGSGFGIMAIIVGVSRGWIGRAEAVERLLTMVRFLRRADSYHGVLPHFLHGETGRMTAATSSRRLFFSQGCSAHDSTSIGKTMPKTPCAPGSAGCGRKPSGAGTRGIALTFCTGTGAGTTAGA
jgi:hypothetical protein